MAGKWGRGCPAPWKNSWSRRTSLRAVWWWNTTARRWRLRSSRSGGSRPETGWRSSGLWRGGEQPIPVVPLPWLVAQVADEPLHVGHAHAESGARLADDVFFDHDAAEIIRAKFQRDLADLLPLGHP